MHFTFPIKILNWNVRGLGDSNKCAVVKDMVCDIKPDLVCFQETKWSECSIFRVRQVCPSRFKNFIELNAEGTRGGILLVWSSSFSLVSSFINSFCVSVILQKKGFHFLVTGVYGPQSDSDKLLFMDELKSISDTHDMPWMLVGDFNLFRGMQDTTGNIRNIGTMQGFNSFIAEAGLTEVSLQGRLYT